MAKLRRKLAISPSGVVKTSGGTVLVPRKGQIQDIHGLSRPGSPERKDLASIVKILHKNHRDTAEYRRMTVLGAPLRRSVSMHESLGSLNEMAFASDKARKAFFAKKVKSVMHEWKTGKLRSGKAPKGRKDTRRTVPKSRKDWALAIALNSAKRYTDTLNKHERIYTGGVK